MFLLLRILFVLRVIAFAWTGYKYLKTRDRRWLAYLRLLTYSVITLLLIFFIGMTIDYLGVFA